MEGRYYTLFNLQWSFERKCFDMICSYCLLFVNFWKENKISLTRVPTFIQHMSSVGGIKLIGSLFLFCEMHEMKSVSLPHVLLGSPD